MALFEAIANSIQSIDDAKINNGEILIELLRRKSLFDGQEDGVLPIDTIKITDNGVGFIEENFISFLSSDSTYKLNRGGKGIGRFVWLKVFDHACVESDFTQDGKSINRYFEFVNNKEAIVNEKFTSAPKGVKGTTVILKHLKEGYLEKFPRTLKDTAEQIIEHLIARLISSSCPKIILRDTSVLPTVEIDINHKFNTDFLLDSDADSFKINNYQFEVALLRVRATDTKACHSIYLSGNDRVVTTTPLNKFIPSLTDSLRDVKTGEMFWIKALVSSAYLDANVNNERTKFSLRSGGDIEGTADIINEITLKEIEFQSSEVVRNYFEGYLSSLRVDKRVNLENALDDMPHFLPLVAYDSVVDSITPAQLQDKNKLNLALQKAKYEILLEAKKEVNDIQSQMENISDENVSLETMSEYKRGFDQLVSKLTAISKSELSEYVVHRRILLDIFEKLLSKKGDGKYPWEEEIHNLIFPKGKTSDEMLGVSQNLWLIDERLSYHKFIASDLPLDKGKKNSGRPDVLIGKQVTNSIQEQELLFDTPLVYSESSRVVAFDSMVVLEFKRAMRKDYAGDKDPIDQIKGYIREIRNGKALDPKGRPIIVSDSCRFYAYLICDLTPELKSEIREMHDFTPMVEGNGLFAMLKSLNTYIEVLSYNKLLSDSAQRNRVLFEKLQMDYV
ncbi:soluble cytochrome b562 [Hymenobacter sp. UYAg731]